MKMILNKDHLVKSLQSGVSYTYVQSLEYLKHVEKNLENNVPNDWRFTKHPLGFFSGPYLAI